MRVIGLMFVVLMIRTASSSAQTPGPCTPPSLAITEGLDQKPPSEADATVKTVALHTSAGAPIPGFDKFPVPAKWDAAEMQKLKSAAGAGDSLKFLWTTTDKKGCVQDVKVIATKPPEAGTPLGQTPTPTVDSTSTSASILEPEVYEEHECGRAGATLYAKITQADPTLDRRRVTIRILKQESGVCFQMNERPTQGDPIHVGLFTDNAASWSGSADYQPCSLEPASPQVLVTDRVVIPSGRQSAGTWRLLRYLPRSCWNATVAINIQGQNRRASYTLAQATRYRATLHLGTVFTENHETTFGLRPDGTNKRVFAQGPVDRGPEYVASLVFYSILRYIPPLGGRAAYPGRDPVRDNAFADKLGGVIGVGLRNPLKRFNTGLALEIAAGVNVLAVWDWAETNVLTGVAEGDLFTGTAEEIPTRREWRQKFVFGISMDLVYASNAFRR